jgi:hypothetical protein
MSNLVDRVNWLLTVVTLKVGAVKFFVSHALCVAAAQVAFQLQSTTSMKGVFHHVNFQRENQWAY